MFLNFPLARKTLLKKRERKDIRRQARSHCQRRIKSVNFSHLEISVIILFLYSLPLPRDSISARNSRRSSVSQRTAKRSRIQEISNDGTSLEPTAVNASAHASVWKWALEVPAHENIVSLNFFEVIYASFSSKPKWHDRLLKSWCFSPETRAFLLRSLGLVSSWKRHLHGAKEDEA